MPRYTDDTGRTEMKKEKRRFPKPWAHEPRANGYAVVDANGFELFQITFTAAEMRDHFPEGLTHEEALSLARFMVGSVNQFPAQDGTVSPGRVQGQVRTQQRAPYRGKPGGHKGYDRAGYV